MALTLKEKAHNARIYRATHKNQTRAYRVANRSRHAAQAAAKRAQCPIQFLVRVARHRAKKQGLPFDLHNFISRLEEQYRRGCELSGVPFVLGKRKIGPYSASLDRKIPSLGYVFSNVRLICFCLNASFGAWGEEITFEIFKAWEAKRCSDGL